MTGETKTHPLAYVVEQTGAPSEDWIRRRLNAGVIPGHRAGRTWRMTDTDIAALIAYMARPARVSAARAPLPTPTGASFATADLAALTPGSRRRLRQRMTA